MSLKCELFGHKSTGYAGEAPYFKIQGGAVDGLGTQHCRLIATCDRCREEYTAGFLHMPKDFDPKTKRTEPCA